MVIFEKEEVVELVKAFLEVIFNNNLIPGKPTTNLNQKLTQTLIRRLNKEIDLKELFFQNLKIKASYGAGTIAKVPWIAFLYKTEKIEMKVSNGIFPMIWFTLKDQYLGDTFLSERSLVLWRGRSFDNPSPFKWKNHDELIKKSWQIRTFDQFNEIAQDFLENFLDLIEEFKLSLESISEADFQEIIHKDTEKLEELTSQKSTASVREKELVQPEIRKKEEQQIIIKSLRLLIDEDFTKIQKLLSELTSMEIFKIHEKEIRYSNAIGWLLNPSENHGLGNLIFFNFIKKIITFDNSKLYKYNVTDLKVLREWKNIDLLLLSDEGKFVIVIEVKILSDEHSNQLQRYKEIINREFQNYEKLFIYLTPTAKEPSDSEYIPVGFSTLVQAIKETISENIDLISRSTMIFIHDFIYSLGRYAMENFQLKDLAKEIYERHKDAFDFIFSVIEEQKGSLSELIYKVLQEFEGVIVDKKSPTLITFTTEKLDSIGCIQQMKTEDLRFSSDGKVLSFVIFIKEEAHINLQLILSSISGENGAELRDKLLLWCVNNKDIFTNATEDETGKTKTKTLINYRLLNKSETVDSEDRVSEILKQRFHVFFNEIIPKVEDSLRMFCEYYT